MIDARHVEFSYHGRSPVLRDMTLQETEGHCIALLGNNGAGKSTFLKCLNRILEPKDGVIVIDGLEIRNTPRSEIAKKMAYVEQHTESSRLTVYDTVLLGRKPHMNFAPSSQDYALVDEIIRRMHIEDLKLRYIDEISGGELQKVVLARALAQQPKVLLLDEPTASLDLRNQHEVMEIISGIAHSDNITVVVVIHDLNLALKYCDRFMLIQNGKPFRYGDISIMNAEVIQEVYGVDAAIAEINGNRFVVVIGNG